MAANLTRADVLRTLRLIGFKRTWRCRAGGDPMLEYQQSSANCAAPYADRKLVVQVWDSGLMRVSHYVTDLTPFGRMCTSPTVFKTATQLRRAVRHECHRTDHPKNTDPRRT